MDLAVIKYELRPKFTGEGMSQRGVPAIIEHPILYQRASHRWGDGSGFDGQPASGCPKMLPLIDDGGNAG
jgi:hypothetical protein